MNFANMRVENISGVLRYFPTSMKWEARKRNSHFVGIMLNGRAHHDLGYQNLTLSENCLFFFNQKDDYKVEVIEPGESFSIHFTTYEEIGTDSFCIPISNPSNIVSILQKAEMKYNTNDALSLFSLLYQLCSEILRIRNKVYSPKDNRIFEAKAYMDLHFREDSCIEMAIANSKLSARRFGELFKRRYDTTPHKYIIFKRIQYAKNLLSVGGLSVTKVAEMCGVSNVYYFSKMFKTETGLSPSEWK